MYEEEYITEEQRKDLQDIFDQFDKDKDGKISAKELKNAMVSMGQTPSDEEINIHININNAFFN